MHITGSPLCIDVGTPDPHKTAAFYQTLFGWELQEKAAGEDYHFALLDGQPVAGIRLDEAQPSAWTLYFGTHDIAASVEHVAAGGGDVTVGPFEVEGRGHIAVIHDPGEAAIGLWQPADEPAFLSSKPGSFTWAELHTPKPADCDAFYARLFSFEQAQIGDGEHVDYSVWSLGGSPLVGRQKLAAANSEAAPLWAVFFDVDPEIGTDALVERATEAGGTVVVEPADIPAGRTATLRDPFGAVFSLVDASRATR